VLSLRHTVQTVERRSYLVREGEHPAESRIVLSGFVFRQKLTGAGAREIVSVHLPGEIVDLHNSFLTVADHSIQALTRAEVALVPRAELADVAARHIQVARALLVETLIDGSILKEWLLNAARRNSSARLAHLLCELAMRLRAAGLGELGRYRIPMTQEELADCLGLTQVHVSRLLSGFEKQGLIERAGRDIGISRWQPLVNLADFDPTYLHLFDAEAYPA